MLTDVRHMAPAYVAVKRKALLSILHLNMESWSFPSHTTKRKTLGRTKMPNYATRNEVFYLLITDELGLPFSTTKFGNFAEHLHQLRYDELGTLRRTGRIFYFNNNITAKIGISIIENTMTVFQNVSMLRHSYFLSILSKRRLNI